MFSLIRIHTPWWLPTSIRMANSTRPPTVGGTTRLEVLLGDGTGRLKTPGTFFATGHRPYERLRTADFNHDGHPDIVTTNLDDSTVSILLGDGRGGFHNAPGSPFPAGAKPWELAIDDLNGDGNADLIVIPYQRDIARPEEDAVTVLLGDGHGGFKHLPGSPLSLGDCRGPNSVAAGDLGGGKSHAIVVACAESRTLRIYQPARGRELLREEYPDRRRMGIGRDGADHVRSTERNSDRQRRRGNDHDLLSTIENASRVERPPAWRSINGTCQRERFGARLLTCVDVASTVPVKPDADVRLRAPVLKI